MDQMAISRGIGDGLAGIEARVFEKLFDRARDDKAMMRIIRWRIARMARPFTVFVKIIFPDELVGEREGVCLKIEWPPGLRGIVLRRRATGKQENANGNRIEGAFPYNFKTHNLLAQERNCALPN